MASLLLMARLLVMSRAGSEESFSVMKEIDEAKSHGTQFSSWESRGLQRRVLGDEEEDEGDAPDGA